jgi:hypothetical protein
MGEMIPPAQMPPHVTAGMSMELGEKMARTSAFCHCQRVLRDVPNAMAVDFTWAKV